MPSESHLNCNRFGQAIGLIDEVNAGEELHPPSPGWGCRQDSPSLERPDQRHEADCHHEVPRHERQAELPVVAEPVSAGLQHHHVGSIPLALNRAVAWAVAAQAVVIEDTGAVSGLRRSAELVKGNWFRVLGTVALIALFVGLPGPVIAFAFLVFTRPPIIETVYPVLSALYVLVLFPLGFIASGLLYGDLCAVYERRLSESDAAE